MQKLTMFFLGLVLLSCTDGFKAKDITPPVDFNVQDEFVYLVSLEGFFTPEEIKNVHRADPSVKYLLASGHGSQRKADKDNNYKSAKEFVDITTKSFKAIKKIKFGGSFMTSALVFDVIADTNNNHYIIFAHDRGF